MRRGAPEVIYVGRLGAEERLGVLATKPLPSRLASRRLRKAVEADAPRSSAAERSGTGRRADPQRAPEHRSSVQRPLQAGEKVLLIDHKRRRYLVTLVEGGEFHTHSGIVGHDVLIGRAEGRTVRSTRGGAFHVVRPTLADTVLHMPAGGARSSTPRTWGPSCSSATSSPARGCWSRASAPGRSR